MILINYLFMCLIFGTTFLAIKIGIDAGAPPFLSAGIRFLLAGLILLLWMVWRKKTSFFILLRKEMLITGFGLTFMTFATLYWAEQYVTSGVAAVLSATGPMMVLILQAIFLRSKISLIATIGCFIGFFGVTLLLFPAFTLEISALWLVGCIVILIGEVGYAAGTVYARYTLVRFKETSPIALNAAQMFYGGIFLSILSFWKEPFQLEAFTNTSVILSIIYLIFIGSMIGHSIYYWLVANTNPLFPSTWLYISPLIAVSLGVIFYQEILTPIMFLGVITVIIGIILVNWEALKQLFHRAKIQENPNKSMTS